MKPSERIRQIKAQEEFKRGKASVSNIYAIIKYLDEAYEKNGAPSGEETKNPEYNWGFSHSSIDRLMEVNSDLQDVTERALELSPVDFGITEGLRTMERQKQLFDAGASWTLNSKHLNGNAIDVVAWVGGRRDWTWPLYERIADAFRLASIELDHEIRWGGAFGLNLGDYPSAADARRAYKELVRSSGKPIRSDGVHFEIVT